MYSASISQILPHNTSLIHLSCPLSTWQHCHSPSLVYLQTTSHFLHTPINIHHCSFCLLQYIKHHISIPFSFHYRNQFNIWETSTFLLTLSTSACEACTNVCRTISKYFLNAGPILKAISPNTERIWGFTDRWTVLS